MSNEKTFFGFGRNVFVAGLVSFFMDVSSEMIYPLVYLVFNLVYSLSAIPAGMAADRFGRKRIILLGFVLFAGLYYGFAVAANASTIWILFGLYGLFMGFTEGIQKAFLATIIPPDLKATAFGIYAACVGLAMLPAGSGVMSLRPRPFISARQRRPCRHSSSSC